MADSGKGGGKGVHSDSLLAMLTQAKVKAPAKVKATAKSPAKSKVKAAKSVSPSSARSDSAIASVKRKAPRPSVCVDLSLGGSLSDTHVSPAKRKHVRKSVRSPLPVPVVDLEGSATLPIRSVDLPAPGAVGNVTAPSESVNVPALVAPGSGQHQLADLATLVANLLQQRTASASFDLQGFDLQGLQSTSKSAAPPSDDLQLPPVSTGIPTVHGDDGSANTVAAEPARLASRQSKQPLNSSGNSAKESTHGLATVKTSHPLPALDGQRPSRSGTENEAALRASNRNLPDPCTVSRCWAGFSTATRTATPSGSGQTSRSTAVPLDDLQPASRSKPGLPQGFLYPDTPSGFTDDRVHLEDLQGHGLTHPTKRGLPYSRFSTDREDLSEYYAVDSLLPEDTTEAAGLTSVGFDDEVPALEAQDTYPSPPVLHRADRSAETESVGSDGEPSDERPPTEAAMLRRAIETVGKLQPSLVRSTQSVTLPGFTAAVSDVTLDYVTHPVVKTWFQYHWNQIRNMPMLGAHAWSPEAVAIADWPKPASTLLPPKVKKGAPEDPGLPRPSGPTDHEQVALLTPDKVGKGMHNLVTTKVLPGLDGHLYAGLEALSAVGAMTSALAVALRDEDNPAKLSDAPDVVDILTLIEALPAAISSVSKAITAAKVVTTVARRDGLLALSRTPKPIADRLRVAPPVKGAMFGPFMKAAHEVAPSHAPLTVDDFANVMTRVLNPAQRVRGWGSTRPFRGRGGRQQQPYQRQLPYQRQPQQPSRGRAPRRARGGPSGRRGQPPPSRAGH